jgi:hypothetical protein
MGNPILGYRRWRVPNPDNFRPSDPDAFNLHPINTTEHGPWRPGVNEAQCTMRESLPSCRYPPAASHGCGFYGYYNIDHAFAYTYYANVTLVGSVISWGNMYFDMKYWRGQYAMVVALLHPDDYVLTTSQYILGDDRLRERWLGFAHEVVEISSFNFGVPVLRKSEIHEYTEQFGEPYSKVISNVELLRALEGNNLWRMYPASKPQSGRSTGSQGGK